jgi:hypothetical protein
MAQQSAQLPPTETVNPFSKDELVMMRSVLRIATMRGAWQDEELEDVGKLVKRVRDVLRRAEVGGRLQWKSTAKTSSPGPEAEEITEAKND